MKIASLKTINQYFLLLIVLIMLLFLHIIKSFLLSFWEVIRKNSKFQYLLQETNNRNIFFTLEDMTSTRPESDSQQKNLWWTKTNNTHKKEFIRNGIATKIIMYLRNFICDPKQKYNPEGLHFFFENCISTKTKVVV